MFFSMALALTAQAEGDVRPAADRAGSVQKNERAAEPAVPKPTKVPEIPTQPVRPTRDDPHLLGSWGGIRPALIDHGITPRVVYLSETAAALDGVSRRDAANATQFAFGFTADLQKLADLPGTFQFAINKRSGPRLDDLTGVHLLQFSQETWGRGRIWRLAQAWYQVSLGKWTLKAGRTAPNEDFNSAACDFQSLYLCGTASGHIAADYWYNYPSSSWGGRIKYALRSDLTLQAGLYQVNPLNIDPSGRGFNLNFSRGTGVLAPVEIAFTPKPGGQPGLYKAGFFFSNARRPDVVLDTNGDYRALTGAAALIRREQWGLFGNIKQQLQSPRPDGSHRLSLFANGTWISNQTETLAGKVAGGLQYTGLVRGRPIDELGIGIGMGKVNDRLSRLQQLLKYRGFAGTVVQSTEYTVELYYGINIVEGLVIRPNVQYTIQPTGDAHRSPLTVLGLKTVATF